MDIKKRKEELKTTFDKVIAQIEQLVAYREQLRGQYSLLDEMSKEDEKEENKDNKKDGSTK